MAMIWAVILFTAWRAGLMIFSFPESIDVLQLLFCRRVELKSAEPIGQQGVVAFFIIERPVKNSLANTGQGIPIDSRRFPQSLATQPVDSKLIIGTKTLPEVERQYILGSRLTKFTPFRISSHFSSYRFHHSQSAES